MQLGELSIGCICVILTWAVGARPRARPVAAVVGRRGAPAAEDTQRF